MCSRASEINYCLEMFVSTGYGRCLEDLYRLAFRNAALSKITSVTLYSWC